MEVNVGNACGRLSQRMGCHWALTSIPWRREAREALAEASLWNDDSPSWSNRCADRQADPIS